MAMLHMCCIVYLAFSDKVIIRRHRDARNEAQSVDLWRAHACQERVIQILICVYVLMSICVTRASLLINIPIYLGFFLRLFALARTLGIRKQTRNWLSRCSGTTVIHITLMRAICLGSFLLNPYERVFQKTNFCVHTITRTWTLVIDVRLKLMCNQTDRISHLGKGL